MKLSDIKGDRVIDVVADLITPIANIAADKESSEFFIRRTLPVGTDAREFILQRIKDNIPKLLKTHKQDIIQILATIKGVTPKEYSKNLTLFTILNDLTDLISDEAFNQLFTSAQNKDK